MIIAVGDYKVQIVSICGYVVFKSKMTKHL